MTEKWDDGVVYAAGQYGDVVVHTVVCLTGDTWFTNLKVGEGGSFQMNGHALTVEGTVDADTLAAIAKAVVNAEIAETYAQMDADTETEKE